MSSVNQNWTATLEQSDQGLHCLPFYQYILYTSAGFKICPKFGEVSLFIWSVIFANVDFSFKMNSFINAFRNTIRASHSLDPDQA